MRQMKVEADGREERERLITQASSQVFSYLESNPHFIIKHHYE